MTRETVHLVRSGIRWEVAPEFAPRLEAAIQSGSTVVKRSAAKLVARHAGPAAAFYFKHYRHDAFPLRPLKFFVKPSPARREWGLAAELDRLGIRIVRHVALGERWSARGLMESILVTEAFDGVPLGEAAGVDPALVVNFVRQLAAAGVLHADLHPANLLVKDAEIRLVDLDGVRLSGLGSDALERDMLAQLCVTTPLPVAAEIRQLGLQKRKVALALRSRRCWKSNRDFAIQEHGGRRWHVRLDAVAPSLLRMMGDPDGWLASSRSLKVGRSSTVGAADGLVLKRFNFRRWVRPLKDLFRESRAHQAFRKAYHLELCGIATARPVAAANERCCGLVMRGFVAMHEMAGATDLSSWNGDRRAARHLGRLIARLHEEGFSHRDLKETNVLFESSGTPLLVDLEGLRFDRDVASSTAAENLRRLAEGAAASGKAGRPAVIAFLLAYCRARRLRPRAIFPRDLPRR